MNYIETLVPEKVGLRRVGGKRPLSVGLETQRASPPSPPLLLRPPAGPRVGWGSSYGPTAQECRALTRLPGERGRERGRGMRQNEMSL